MTYYVGSERTAHRFNSIETARAYSIGQIEEGRYPSIYVGEKRIYYGKVYKGKNGEYCWTGLSNVSYRINRDGRITGKASESRRFRRR